MKHIAPLVSLAWLTGMQSKQLIAPPLLILAAAPTIAQFFTNLFNDLTPFALAASTFFFAWAAILYMSSGGHNTRRMEAATSALYAALVGLALALLAGVIAGLINAAATTIPGS